MKNAETQNPFSSEPQRHHRMKCAKKDQSKGKRNVHQQPAVQPAVQALLQRQLARLAANAFKVGERGVCGRGQKSAQTGKGAACCCRIREALTSLSRTLEKGPHLVQIKTAQRRAFFLAQQNKFSGGGDCSAGTGTNRCGRS